MTPPSRPSSLRPFDLDPVRTGGAIAGVAALLSVALPFFDGLVMALAALVPLAWAIDPARRRRDGWRPWWVPAAIIAGWCVFVALPPAALALRGVALGAGLLPLQVRPSAGGASFPRARAGGP